MPVRSLTDRAGFVLGSAPLGVAALRAGISPTVREGSKPELQTEPSLTVGLVPRQHTRALLVSHLA